MGVLVLADRVYTTENDLQNLISYIVDESKQKRYKLKGGMGVAVYRPEIVSMQFMQTIRFYTQNKMDTYAYHLILSFERGISIVYIAEYCNLLSNELGNKGYQNLFAVHSDTDHTHAHFAVNPVNYVTGHIWDMTYGDCQKMRNKVEEVLMGRFQ